MGDDTRCVDGRPWFSTEDAARAIGGVSTRWMRIQIEEGRLRTRVLLTGRRATYAIFEATISRPS